MMKCQHCGVDDNVLIQGQNYCLNCGYAIAAPPPNLKTKKTTDEAAEDPDETMFSDLGPKPEERFSVTPIHPVRLSLLVAGLAAAVSGVVTALALGFNVDTDTSSYVIVAMIIALAVVVGMAHTALLYGRSRRQDGRPAPRAYWWMAARSGFLEVVNVQLMAAIASLVVVGVDLLIWQAIAGLNINEIIMGVALGIINLAAAWALLGIYTAARLATPAIIVGGMNATEAARVGWKLYLRAGGHLLAAAVEALLGRVLAVGLLAVLGYALAASLHVQGLIAITAYGALGAAALVFCASFLILEVDTKLWLAQYRNLAMLCPPAERVRLLTGRVQSHAAS